MKARTIASVAALVLAIASRVEAQPVLPAPDVAPPAAAPAPLAQPQASALPPAQITASVRSAGFDPLSRPVRRGTVYYVFALDRNLTDVRVMVDAHSGRVLSATRLAGTAYGGPGYESYGRRYEPAPVPPGEIPLQQQPRRPPGPAALEARRHPAERPGEAAPLPRARPDEVVTGNVKEAAPRVQPDAPAANPPAADPAAAAGSAKPQPAPPQPPIMVPVAPLE